MSGSSALLRGVVGRAYRVIDSHLPTYCSPERSDPNDSYSRPERKMTKSRMTDMTRASAKPAKATTATPR